MWELQHEGGTKKIVKTSDKKIVCKHTNLKHTVA